MPAVPRWGAKLAARRGDDWTVELTRPPEPSSPSINPSDSQFVRQLIALPIGGPFWRYAENGGLTDGVLLSLEPHGELELGLVAWMANIARKQTA